ncbi:PEP-CTERM sorting domain-containing protein [Botrimarina mediterranea]|uniref:Ice-binding protein C-terminal domain-containing protein n=1 Tax=Botrimarina mediterranea TaxID=2528022 RepID=A0A518K9W8_9BACT|nr:PEP-CTERM sorting domain-containing protein [Botrimarina mediterranea]QDV74588.1 hypothetical protein Spa11_27940 [Botrimarina mediterranea]
MARILVLLALCANGVADAALIGSPEFVHRSVPGAPAGHVVNGMSIDFDGQLFGQQLVVTLTQGTIYQDVFGTETPPSPALFPIFPSLAADTFVAIGGYDSVTSRPVIVIGGTTELGVNGPKKFDNVGINITWAPAPGVVVNGGRDFPIAQITLSNDARGSWHYFGNAGGTGVVTSGCISGGGFNLCPEPASLLLAGFGAIAAALRPTRRE